MDFKRWYFLEKQEIEGLDGQPKLWLSDIYKTQDDDIWNGKYENSDIFKSMKSFMSKDEFTELLKLEWLAFLFPNVRKYLSNALANNKLIFSTKNDRFMPDIKVDCEWYEFSFASIEIFKHKDGHEFEISLFDRQNETNVEELMNDETTLKFGDGEIAFAPEEMAKVKYDKIANTIEKKLKKDYRVEEPVNLVIFTERNLNHDIFMQPLGVKYLFDNYLELINDAVKKFKKIYICTEDKVANEIFLKANNKEKVERAVGFYIDRNNINFFNSSDIDSLFAMFYHTKQNFIFIANKK